MNTLEAMCAIGGERVLGNEIKALGYKLKGSEAGRVIFEGDNDSLFRSNLYLRSADKVYLELSRFYAEDFDELFGGVYNIDWQDFFRKDSKITVDKIRVYKSRISGKSSIQSIVQKAIYQKLCDKWSMRTMPESGEESFVRVFITKDKASILLDLSGEPLFKRGYRLDGGVAPIRETVANLMLQMMLWRRKTALIDPFCGSGTIAIEASLYAHNIAPGLSRKFAIEELPFFNKDSARSLREEAAGKIRSDVKSDIQGGDIDEACVERARANAERAMSSAGRALQSIGSDAKLERPVFKRADFRDLYCDKESAPYGLILCNPPYGERLSDKDAAQALYADMSYLFQSFAGYKMGVITEHLSFQKCIGHKATFVKHIKAGRLETHFYMYDKMSAE